MTRLSAIIVPLAAIVLNASAASAQPALGKAEGFAVLAGTAVTCTDSTVTGDVGVWPGNTFSPTRCTVVGAVHLGDGVAKQAYLDFISAYENIEDNLPTCDADHTLTGTLAGVTLLPGVYCVAATAKAGTLTLDAGTAGANAEWLFLVSDDEGTGALTGTDFNVVMINGGEPCNVTWWVEAGATLTTSNFLGTILAGAAITVTGVDGGTFTFDGHAFATTAVTLTGGIVSACEATGHGHGRGGKCNQGVGNGPEVCDPGNSNNHNPSNDELGGTPGNPGRKAGGIGT